jgi:hypothetical protein
MNKAILRFFNDALVDMINSRVRVRFENTPYASYYHGKHAIQCEGWFNGDIPEFVCAMAKPTEQWLLTFGHEYAHFLQWREKDSVWLASDPEVRCFDRQLAGKKVARKKLLKALRLIQLCELDCEKRMVNLFKKYRIKLDYNRVVARSNAYVFFYSTVTKYGRWYQTGPQVIKEVIDTMPTKYLPPEQYQEPPQNYLDQVEALCFQSGKENEF